ncbi:MAG: GEVED domain-containing protein, partial [Dermatophilaceae bacterium]
MHRRVARRVAAATAVVLAASVVLVPTELARAYQIPSAAWGGSGASAVGTTPSGLTMTAAVTGVTTVNNRNFIPGTSYGATAAMFTPGVNPANATVQLLTNAGGCAAAGVCPGRGTVTLSFSQPVRNPVLHVAGLGGASVETNPITNALVAGSAIHTRATLTGSVPAGATFGTTSSGGTNLTGTATTFETSNFSNSGACNNFTGPAGLTLAATAGCGSIPVVGTVTELTLGLDVIAQIVFGPGAVGSPTAGDGWSLTFTADEDYGDAPTSYEAGAPASHIVGDLRLGAAIDRENSTTVNGGTVAGGLSVAAGANANAPLGDGADDDGVSSFPNLTTDLIGSTYTVPVALGGASKAGTVCGYLDFDRSLTWNTAERACATFAAGATTANLTWTIANTTAGRTYARVRVSYTAAQAQSPTGLADSGEVEDYTLEIKPVVRVLKAFAPTTDPGSVNLQINGSTFATGVSNGGTTNFRTVYNNTAPTAPDVTVSQNVQTQAVPITVSETGGPGTNLADYTAGVRCVDGNGTVVSTSSTVNIPQSNSASGGNGRAQTITCTFTNTRRLTLVNDTASTPNDTNVTVPVLGNDIPGGAGPIIPTSVVFPTAGQPAGATVSPDGKSVTVPGQGTYTVNPTTGVVTFDPLPSFSGVATPVTYQAGDGAGTSTATITITVAPLGPLASPDTGTTPQDVPVTTAILGNDSGGAAALDPATVVFPTTGQPAGATVSPDGRTLTVPGEGTYTINPTTGAVTFDPLPAFTGTATAVTYRVANAASQTTTSTLTITVTPITPNAVDDAATTPNDTPVTVPLLTNDTPGDPSAPLDPTSVVFPTTGQPAGATVSPDGKTLTVPGEGTYTINPDGSLTFDPLPAFTGT